MELITLKSLYGCILHTHVMQRKEDEASGGLKIIHEAQDMQK